MVILDRGIVFLTKLFDSLGKRTIHFWISLGISVAIVISGIAGCFVIHNKIKNIAVAGESSLGTKEGAQINLNTNDIEYIQERVVQVESDGSIGSGFLYNCEGDIITNAHVVVNSASVIIKMRDKTVYEGSVIGRDEKKDIALVRVNQLAGIAPLKIIKDKTIKITDEVIALGSPLGLQNTVTMGRISGVDRTFRIGKSEYKNVFQTDAAISPGNSGGPLILKNTGEVIGINSAGNTEGENMAFSIPISQVMEQVEKWSQNPQADKQTDPMIQAVEEVVTKYYDYINNADYVMAYSLLCSSLQKQTYLKFRDDFKNVFTIEITDIDSTQVENDVFSIAVSIATLEYGEKEREHHQYNKKISVGYEYDELRILSIEEQ